ncbi:cytochrome c3 family protein [Spirochaetota bacterium]
MKHRIKYIYIMLLLITTLVTLLFSGNKVFNHKGHTEQDMECTQCHKKIKTSVSAEDMNLPGEDSCSECHESKLFKATKFYRSAPKYKINNNHQVHSDMGHDCTVCHEKINDPDYVPGSALPDMQVCYKCHDNKTAPKTCTLCHVEKMPFPHKLHVDKSKCEDCHKDVVKSNTVLGPRDQKEREKVCIKCHAEKDKYPAVIKYLNRERGMTYKFNHSLHIENEKKACEDCHSVVNQSDDFQYSEIIPKMAYCFTCHDNYKATKNCSLCHFDEQMPEDHNENWETLHKVKANYDYKSCNACHYEKSFCFKCHNGIKKPINSHNPNYELTHKYDVSVSNRSCKSCHFQRFCKSCHASKGIRPGNKFGFSPHPAGWLNPNSPDFHNRKARLRLSACTACHTKNDCNFCHIKRRR